MKKIQRDLINQIAIKNKSIVFQEQNYMYIYRTTRTRSNSLIFF